jgi:hypothetical protein
MRRAQLAALIFLLVTVDPQLGQAEGPISCAVTLEVTTPLTLPNVPMDPAIDFASLMRQSGLEGRLSPGSIEVIDLETGQAVSRAVAEDFAYGDSGRVQWVIHDPTHTRYEIRFKTRSRWPGLKPAEHTPVIGTGDLLRYNASIPRPIALCYPSRLVDLNGDGARDLLGCWNYAYRPGAPWDGIVCYPRVGKSRSFEFGDLLRVRHVDRADSRDFQHFQRTYMHADFADLNGDRLIDVVYSPRRGTELQLFLNTGRRDAGGMPVFAREASISRKTSAWGPCRIVDLNGDGSLDVVIAGTYLKNSNSAGWPLQLADPVALDAGTDPCFFDVDEDGSLDAVCLVDGVADTPRAKRVAWRRNLGEDPPQFAAPKRLRGIDDFWCSYVCAVKDGSPRGLLVQHDVYQAVSFYAHRPEATEKASFHKLGQAKSLSAVMSLSDQAWPWFCDWDDDGDLDMLVGGGYGWPRIVINEGTTAQPKYADARRILADGKPIRILRDEILGGEHWHNMGYPYPVYADWDADGLPDLLLPNETNRILWYKNIGTRSEPRFGNRDQIHCEGFPDGPKQRAESARLAADRKVANNPYPHEKQRPFFWRTGVAFADFTGDGLMDLVTHSGADRKATLFAQYRDASSGSLRLKRVGPLNLTDGRLIDDQIVDRRSHWTESFRPVDWDADGRTDLVYSCAGAQNGIQDGGSIYLLRNVGSKTSPRFEPPQTLRCFGEPIRVTNHGPQPWVGDWDGDSKPDLVACVEWSVYPVYRHAALIMKERPKYKLGELRVELVGK